MVRYVGSEKDNVRLCINLSMCTCMQEKAEFMMNVYVYMYTGHERKQEHDSILQDLTKKYPTVTFVRYQTVDILLNSGANPVQQDDNRYDALHFLRSHVDESTFLRLDWLWR